MAQQPLNRWQIVLGDQQVAREVCRKEECQEQKERLRLRESEAVSNGRSTKIT